MQIGEMIRKHRKLKGLTQEEMAVRLGVTAPAVNKWENGNSLPDIQLLAPIARLLGITPDILLSFRAQPTDEEIGQILLEAGERLKNQPYEEVFQWAKKQAQAYPDCGKLNCQLAALMDAYRLTGGVSDAQQYDDAVSGWYVRALESKDADVRYRALESLAAFYSRKKQYDRAEEYLAAMSDHDPLKKLRQGMICEETGRAKEAYQTYEQMLFSGFNLINMVFYRIYEMAVQEQDMEKARRIVEKQETLIDVFEMGEYQKASLRLDYAVRQKDSDSVIAAMQTMLAGLEQMDSYAESFLYEHLTFQKLRKDFLNTVKKNLLDYFGDEQTFGFLKEDKRWQKISAVCRLERV